MDTLVGAGLFLPAVAWTTPSWRWPAATWAGIALATAVRAASLAALGAAYSRGDLSLVYPLAHPGERHPAPRLAGAGLILAGVLLLGLAGA